MLMVSETSMKRHKWLGLEQWGLEDLHSRRLLHSHILWPRFPHSIVAKVGDSKQVTGR